jgi:DNA processing protein
MGSEGALSQDIVTNTSMSNRQKIVTALGPTPVEIDELVRHCALPVSHVQLVLIELSLANRIEYHPGNKVSLIMNG